MNHAAALAYFSGKSLVNATAALALLDASVAQGFWIKGASRKVGAALNKCNVAAKTTNGHNSYGAVFEINNCLHFGLFKRAQTVDVAAIEAEINDAAKVAYFRAYAAAFADIAAAMQKLDATRPIPVFTSIGASPTVTRTLTSLDAASFTVCPIVYDEKQGVDKAGKTFFYFVARLVWPEGTKHGTSPYRAGHQCQACGHAIKNPCNWCPLVLTANDGTPKSLWVGRDCAKTCFGVDMTGELEIEGGRGA